MPAVTMPTVLITGFGRFPGSPFNPSGPVATGVAARRRPALAGTRRVAHVFATRYDAVDRELAELIAREKPDIVMMFGVHMRSHEIRIERIARNRIALLPDAGGRRPRMQTIAHGVGAITNPLPLAGLVAAARATGVAAVRSHNAGSYLCNYAYWRGLKAAARPDGPQVVVFVHIPPVGIKSRKKTGTKTTGTKTTGTKTTGTTTTGNKTTASKPAAPGRRGPPAVGDLVRAGEAVLQGLIAASRRGARSAAPRKS